MDSVNPFYIRSARKFCHEIIAFAFADSKLQLECHIKLFGVWSDALCEILKKRDMASSAVNARSVAWSDGKGLEHKFMCIVYTKNRSPFSRIFFG